MTSPMILFMWIILVEGLCGECDQNQVCDDPLEILNSIKAYSDNYQQLLNAFYPLNQAKPSSVIIAYFSNYTEPLPEECSLGTYPWRTYPEINHTYHTIYWYMWTTTPIYSVSTSWVLLEFGEYLPTLTYYLLFNKSSPFFPSRQIACIKSPLITDDNWPVLGDDTIQLMHDISSKLGKKNEDKAAPGIFYMHLDRKLRKGGFRYDVDITATMPRRTVYEGAMVLSGYDTQDTFCLLVATLLLFGPFLLYTKGRKLVKRLEQSRSRAKVPFFWAVASLTHVFNIYILAKMILIGYHGYEKGALEKQYIIVFAIIVCIPFALIGITAYCHSKYITFPIPKTWSMLTICCGRKQHRIITTMSLWGICMTVICLLGCLPFQLLLVSANPHLHGFAVLTVWCAMFLCIIVISIPFTIDQVFIKEEDYRITPKQACRQILLLMFTAVLVFGFGSLTFSITLVLHLSKYGEKTQSVSTSVYFLLRHVAIPIRSHVDCEENSTEN